jgi:hypothetical protein
MGNRWRAANREKIREQDRRRYAANLEKAREKTREKARRLRAANPEKAREKERLQKERLDDHVIAKYLKIPAKLLREHCPALIEAKRQQILLTREIRKQQQQP